MDGQTFRSSIRISLYVCSQRRRWSEEREVRPRGTGPRVTLTPIIWKTPDANFKCSKDQSLLGEVLHGSWQLCSRAFRKLYKLLTELQRREDSSRCAPGDKSPFPGYPLPFSLFCNCLKTHSPSHLSGVPSRDPSCFGRVASFLISN